MDKQKEIANLMRIMRLSKGYSQEYVATKMGMSQTAYSKIERGATVLSVKHIANLSRIFDVDAETFLRSPLRSPSAKL